MNRKDIIEDLLDKIGIEGAVPVFKSLTFHSDRKNNKISSADGRTVNMKKEGKWCAKARSNTKLPNSTKWEKICGWGHTPHEALNNLLKQIKD